ncbi:hypothetical protein A5844_000743 [Enterococcus sp. 10A9_DIV0425]|uniref:IrrE N-terminal-like domain-containing protein n=1 Tax=Candidatus Enterococcus wittei TaxID=1987383 RepID=A0A2C9XQQ4_9ENTE|nr:ImmA/IrrE family metallo-endopeptidase [Enterococcus sp. 10A9_DIV0425]OTP12510.1 hypothetical protein A5844_000743 [Enterococcus sp. 10A9_DIV0425]
MNNVELLMSMYPELTYKYETEMPDRQKGLYIDNVVYLNPHQSLKEMTDTVAEEIGHYLTTVGDIIAQDTNEKRKQEQKARDVGVTLVVAPQDFIDCYKERFKCIWECADFLGITKKTLENAIAIYSKMYEFGLEYKNYKIFFRPNGTVSVIEWFK